MSSFVRACAVSDLKENGAISVVVGDEEMAIVKTEGEVYAIHNICSHEYVPLSEGEVDGHTLECYLHGSSFDLKTGEPLQLPATVPVPVYTVKIEGDDVLVDIEES